MTRYCALDLETTGLDPDLHQILELAAVVETDWRTPVGELPRLHVVVRHDPVYGSPAALAMHPRLLADIARRSGDPAAAGEEPRLVEPADLCDLLGAFLGTYFPGERVTLAGKNVGAFDLPFLRRLNGWGLLAPRVRHRVLDVGCLWWEPDRDAKLPDTAECAARSGVAWEWPHTALGDAMGVVGMVRARFPGLAHARGAA